MLASEDRPFLLPKKRAGLEKGRKKSLRVAVTSLFEDPLHFSRAQKGKAHYFLRTALMSCQVETEFSALVCVCMIWGIGSGSPMPYLPPYVIAVAAVPTSQNQGWLSLCSVMV